VYRKAVSYQQPGDTQPVNKVAIDAQSQKTVPLKDPVLAAFLAWLVPGLGHLYQGRTAKAILFFVCLMGTFLYGCYLGSGDQQHDVGWARVVYFQWDDDDIRYSYFGQVGIGLPALPAMVQAFRARHGNRPLWGGLMAPPRPVAATGPVHGEDLAWKALANQPTLDDLHYQLRSYFELGTVYTLIAGLLNVLAIYDAWGGPVFAQPRREDEDRQSRKKDGKEKDKEAETAKA